MTKQKPTLNQEDIKLLKSVFATKGDLVSRDEHFEKTFSSKKDLVSMEERFDKKFITKDELVALEIRSNYVIDDLREKIRLLPTRDEFLTKMDEVMGELQASREEQTILSYRVSKHSDDIEELQNIHPKNAHQFALAS